MAYAAGEAMDAILDKRIVCKATTAAGQPCTNTANGADMVRCTAHQRPGCPPGRVIHPNSAHRTLLKRARAQWRDRLRRAGGGGEGPRQLARSYGGRSSWWSKVITTERSTPKFLHGAGIARLYRYLDSPEVNPPAAPPIVDVAHVPESVTGTSALTEALEEWRRSQEAVEEEKQLQANVSDLAVRLARLESMVAEILQTLTKGASS